MPPHGLSSLTEASRIRAVAPPKASHSIGSAGLQIGGRNQIVSGNDLLNQLLRSSNLHTENTGNLFAGIAGEQRSSTADTTAWRLGDNAPDKTSVVFPVLVQVLQQYHQQQQQRLFQQQQQEMQMLQQIQNISDQQQQLLFLIQLLSQQQQLQSQNESAPVSFGWPRKAQHVVRHDSHGRFFFRCQPLSQGVIRRIQWSNPTQSKCNDFYSSTYRCLLRRVFQRPTKWEVLSLVATRQLRSRLTTPIMRI
jgi:hypothetical protein